MDRQTRKANLKKLQIPSTSGNKQRKSRQKAKPATITNTAITKYFLTPEKCNTAQDESDDVNKCSPIVCNDNEATQSSDNINTCVRTRAKRTKLDGFIFKDPNNIPNSIKKVRISLNDDDFVPPDKTAKKAPRLRHLKSATSSRAKKQTTIKSAFLRNEQLFAEIAAQHCAADQFDADDVQLALAISKSQADSDGIIISDENVVDDNDINNEAESIRQKLKKYGFRTAESKDYNTFAAAFLPKINNRRPKTKWANRFTALTLRSSDTQMIKLKGNIEKLLSSQFRTKPTSHHETFLPYYKLQSSLLKSSRAHENKRVLLAAENISKSNELFFVTELFEITQLPAGYLLRDWATIQGRDFTPNKKNKQSIDKIKILEGIYQELEDFFRYPKSLDCSANDDNNEDEKIGTNEKILNKEEKQEEICSVVQNSGLNSSQIVDREENIELNKMVELLERLQRNEEIDNLNTDTSSCASTCNNKILELLPTTKSLDRMQVSSCSINTQATINSTPKNRSNSPDLFADSDVEMDEVEKHAQNDQTEETVINATKVRSRRNSIDRVETDVITYEIFSSDEVKNTSLLECNNAALKESAEKNCNYSNAEVIDLTQDDFQLSTSIITNDSSNQSKLIEEIDLFAESPPQDEANITSDVNSNSQNSKCRQENQEEAAKFSLSLEINDKERQMTGKEMQQDHFKLSPRALTKQQLTICNIHQDDDDVVLREIALDQTNASFLNFQGCKQLETSFHRKTTTVETDIIKDNLADNDITFRELCNKYLNKESSKTSSVNKLESRDYLKISLSQTIPTINCNNIGDFTMTSDMTRDKNVTLKRKSTSFTAKTPLKFETKESNRNLFKCLSANDHRTNISIDLTQNDVEECEDDDDDCLVLSDDEINYSIWQANNSIKFKTSEQSNLQEDINAPDNDSNSDEENIIEFPDEHDDNMKFSYLDLQEKEKFEKSLIKISLGPEQSISDFEILASKYSTYNSNAKDEEKFDRSEFGILEEYSQPIDRTPNLCTPTKVLTEASFLISPSETSAPMKRFSNSRSSQKFQDLLNNIPAKSPPHAVDKFNDFDEFDRLVYTSPPLTSDKSNKRPQGIDQLLTAEISFKESQKLTEKTTKKVSSESLESTIHEVKHNNKTYIIRYTSSPKPDYTKYSEAELLKELYNFGIKPLKRRHAVKLLEYIYNQTHPILIEEEGEPVEQQSDPIIVRDSENPCTSKEALKAKTLLTKHQDNSKNKATTTESAQDILDVASKNLNLQDGCGLDMLRYSVDLKAELFDENYILQTNVSKKTPQPLLPFHIAWYNLVCSNQRLHESMLMYEPIDLQEVYLFLKSLGYRYDPKDLKTFFDRRCIIFRYDIGSGAGSNGIMKHANRHVRKSKKPKSA